MTTIDTARPAGRSLGEGRPAHTPGPLEAALRHMASRRDRHEGITFDYGNTILSMIERNAESLADAIGPNAAELVHLRTGNADLLAALQKIKWTLDLATLENCEIEAHNSRSIAIAAIARAKGLGV